jgi:O-antigen ligase
LWLLATPATLTRAFRRHKTIIVLFFLIPLWATIQLIPLPTAFIQSVSPHIAQYNIGRDWQTISLDHKATLYQIQKSMIYGLFFVMTLVLVNTIKRLEFLLQLIIISGVLQAFYGVLVATGGQGFDILHIRDLFGYNRSASGTYINRNHFAGYLEMCLAVGVGLLVSHILANKRKFAGWRAVTREFLISLFSGKARLRIFLALMVVALVLSHSRMGNTAFFASLGASAILGLWLYRKSTNATSLVILFSSLILVDIFILGAWFGLEEVAKRLEGTTTETESRFYVFQSSLTMIRDFWLTGSGAGTYYTVFPYYRTNQVYGFYDHVHNDFMELLIEYGVIGSTFFAMIVLYCFIRSVQAQSLRYTAMLRGAGFAAMMGILSLMIHSGADFNLQIPANAVLFSVLCAFACIAYSMEQQEHSSRRRKVQESSD